MGLMDSIIKGLKTAAPQAAALSGNYQTAQTGGISFEVPAEFEEFDAGAAEVQAAYTYGDGDMPPYICIQDVGGGLPTVKEPVSKGIMKYSSNGWVS